MSASTTSPPHDNTYFSKTDTSPTSTSSNQLVGKASDFAAVLHESARLSAVSLFCIGTASAFGWLLAYYRVPQALVGALAGFATVILGLPIYWLSPRSAAPSGPPA